MKKVKRRFSYSIVWIAAFAGCLVFAASMLFSVVFLVGENAQKKAELESGYQKSFNEMSQSANNIELNLSKLMVSIADDQTVELTEAIRIDAINAAKNLSLLPIDSKESHKLSNYFIGVNMWCESYCREMLTSGETMEFEQRVEGLYDASKSINNEIAALSSNIRESGYNAIQSKQRKGVRPSKNVAPFVTGENVKDDLFDITSEDFEQTDIKPLITEKDAKSAVSPKLNINDVRLVQDIVNNRQSLYYEIECDYKGLDYLIYVDSVSGKQVDIQRVITRY